MRFVVTGEWNRNRLLQVIVVLYALYVALLVVTNTLLYFDKMSLAPASVVAHYLGKFSRHYTPAGAREDPSITWISRPLAVDQERPARTCLEPGLA